MITDRDTLGQAMVELTRSVANAIDMFEKNTDGNSTVKCVDLFMGRSAIIPDEPMIRVSVRATLDTGTEQFDLTVHGDD